MSPVAFESADPTSQQMTLRKPNSIRMRTTIWELLPTSTTSHGKTAGYSTRLVSSIRSILRTTSRMGVPRAFALLSRRARKKW